MSGIQSLALRYGFAKSPQTLAEVDFQKGVVFLDGRLNSIVIDQIQLYSNGIAIDTRSSTDDCVIVLEDILSAARESNGADVIVSRKHFVSNLVFRSPLKLSLLNPTLQPIADFLSEQSSETLHHAIKFEPTAILIGADSSQLKIVPSVFSVERRAEAPFTEHTYFSAAPLSTEKHLKLLAELETALSESRSAA